MTTISPALHILLRPDWRPIFDRTLSHASFLEVHCASNFGKGDMNDSEEALNNLVFNLQHKIC
jgi:hypothetical protein